MRQQKIKERQEKDRLLKLEVEAAAAAKRAELIAKQEAAAKAQTHSGAAEPIQSAT